MSDTTLHCPTCDAPVAPRIETNLRPVLERYTCPACGRTTLREELVRRRELRSVMGGVPHGLPGGTSETHFILVPPGVTGDQSLSTALSASAGAAVTIETGWTASVGEQHDTQVVSISIRATIMWERVAQGPAVPTLRLQFREGSSGTVRNAVATAADTIAAESSITNIGPYSISTNQDGGAWTWARLASLQFNLQADVDDLGSQLNTNITLYEVSAEVFP